MTTLGVVESATARKDHMRFITSALIVTLVQLALTFGTRAQQSQTSPTPSAAWNNNSLITVQKEGGDPARAGDLKIEFYGHDAFKITSSERFDGTDRSLAK